MSSQQPVVMTPLEPTGSPTTGVRLAAVAALVLLLAVTLLQIYRATSIGNQKVKDFAYASDGAYEHLVIARELAKDPNIRSDRFGGATPLVASASPAWSVGLVSLLRIPALSPEAGRDIDEVALLPLVINLVAAAAMILVAGHLVRREIAAPCGMFGFLLAVGMLIPLPLLVMTGMSHVTHMVVMLLAVAVGIAAVQSDRPYLGMTILAVILTATNVALGYEGLAVMVALFLWGWIQGHTGRKMFSALAGIGVVVAVGLCLSANGGAFVPNATLIHLGQIFAGGWRDWPGGLLAHARQTLVQAPVPWAMLLIASALLAGGRGRAHSPDPMERNRTGWLFVFVFAALAHMLVGQTGMYRQEAYLIPLGMVAIVRTLAASVSTDRQRQAQVAQSKPPAAGPVGLQERLAVLHAPTVSARRGHALALFLCIIPVLIVAVPYLCAFTNASQRARDAFVRDRVAATFVRTYFTNGPVAVNEAGAIGYETAARLVDLSGWTDTNLALARLHGRYTADLVARRVADAGAQVALVMGDRNNVLVPPEWKEVGGWHRVGEGRESASAVRVYAVSAAMEYDVRSALRLFSVRPDQPQGIEYWLAESQTAPATRTAMVPSPPGERLPSSGTEDRRAEGPSSTDSGCLASCHPSSGRADASWN